MDRQARLAFVSIHGLSQETTQSTSKPRILSFRICEELPKARVPGFLLAYESGEDTWSGNQRALNTSCRAAQSQAFKDSDGVRAW